MDLASLKAVQVAPGAKSALWSEREEVLLCQLVTLF